LLSSKPKRWWRKTIRSQCARANQLAGRFLRLWTFPGSFFQSVSGYWPSILIRIEDGRPTEGGHVLDTWNKESLALG
jgi:hypothetical protein